MTLNLKIPNQVVSSSYARWLIYGPNGSGKTTLAATLPRPMMVISALGENMAPYSPAKTIRVNGKDMPDVVINEIDDWDRIRETFQYLRSPESPYQSCVFDTLTRIMGFYLEKLTGLKRSGIEVGAYLAQRPTLKSKNFETWSDLGFMSTQVVSDFNQLPMHTIYLCQEDTKRPEFENDILETIPVLSPASWKGVKDIVHLIGRLYVVEATGGTVSLVTDGNRGINPNRRDQRMLLIGQHDRYFSKGDTARLGYAIPDPTWENLSKGLKT